MHIFMRKSFSSWLSCVEWFYHHNTLSSLLSSVPDRHLIGKFGKKNWAREPANFHIPFFCVCVCVCFCLSITLLLPLKNCSACRIHIPLYDLPAVIFNSHACRCKAESSKRSAAAVIEVIVSPSVLFFTLFQNLKGKEGCNVLRTPTI